MNNIIEQIRRANVTTVIFDIDGTLKDLCKEHHDALIQTILELDVGRVRAIIITTLNKIAIGMVKSGIFPTNRTNQNLLIKIFSLIACIRPKKFLDEYYKFYKQELRLFNGTEFILETLFHEKDIFFSTINAQNYNIEMCGIPETRIICASGMLKITTYAKLLKKINVSKEQIIIVGDNFFDDIVSARLLGVKAVLVNNYNSRFKERICRMINKYLE